MNPSAPDAAIYYEADGYDTGRNKLMGRHAAGEAFLRAAIAAHAGRDIWCCAQTRNAADAFARHVRAFDPKATPRWAAAHKLETLEQIGTLYYPSPEIHGHAELRLRRRPDAFSLCGVTHTTASDRVMALLATTMRMPLMPWDAIVCTSNAVAETMRLQQEAEAEYLRWRFGNAIALPETVRFPVIPLGVHAGDFAVGDKERAQARKALGIKKDEVAALFVGRLSFHAKAHPDQMYQGLQAAAGKARLVLIHCGWFGNEGVEKAFRAGAALAKNMRSMFIDGRKPDLRRQCWAAGDIFVSLSDNIQETFGLTPIEAMARGMPAVVTDWNGYKETVRDGIDGYRIPTRMPPAGLGRGLAQHYEAGSINYDRYCGYCCTLTSADAGQLAARLGQLASDKALRRKLGDNGRKRVLEIFEWSIVYRAYQDLWRELGEIRRTLGRSGDWAQRLRTAPRASPGRGDPLLNFGHYCSQPISAATRVASCERPDGMDYPAMRDHPLYNFAHAVLPAPELAKALRDAAATPVPISELARQLGQRDDDIILAVAGLAKMGLVRLDPYGADRPT
ncbi:MAG: glycosyltransferase family 4 protein [Sphingosinicella sp.]